MEQQLTQPASVQPLAEQQDMGPQTVDFNPPFRKTISRLFIFRGLRVFVMIWPLYVWAIWEGILGFLHFWYKLILGQRHEGFWKSQVRFMRHVTKWYAYFGGIVDQRPDFISD